jgi:hypothetical protein
MTASLSLLPNLESLTAGLARALADGETGHSPLTILERRPQLPAMTFPSERVICRLGDGKQLKLLCKYEAGCAHNAHGHRGGIAYEAEVYRRVLGPIGFTTPGFYGVDTESDDGAWLILEYLDGCVLLRDVHLDTTTGPEPTEMGLAARWIGRFHAVNEARLDDPALSFLKRYDTAYYRGWARRTTEFAPQLPWLAKLCERADDLFAPLLRPPQTVIHGELYGNNILLRERTVHPVDWESAAIAPGEIDFAALTDGPWAADLVEQSEREYQTARWPVGLPSDFAARCDAARLYLHFRSLGELGERPDKASHPRRALVRAWRFEQLRRVAEQLGLV